MDMASRASKQTEIAIMMAPRSVAIVGASDDVKRIGGRPISYILQKNFPGDLFPINPKRKTVQGLAAFSGIDALPYCPDVALVAVAADVVVKEVTALGKAGVRGPANRKRSDVYCSSRNRRRQRYLRC